MAFVLRPQQADVLCGRGKHSFGHSGNQFFRRLIVSHTSGYKVAPTRKEKSQVVMLVARIIIARGGRFLVRNKGDGTWRDGGLKQGQKKTGNAFRDALRGRVKRVTERTTTISRAPRIDPETMTTERNTTMLRGLPKEVSGLNPTDEPPSSWVTARMMDAELATYMRSLFPLPKCTILP